MLAKTPSPPYYAVIFSSTRTDGDNGYQEMSELKGIMDLRRIKPTNRAIPALN